jgi:tellurite methyltransferase
MKSDRKKWDERFKERAHALGKKENSFLRRHIRMLSKGKGLDVATGEGRNAVFLAQHGFDVDAIDISPLGLKKVRRLALEKKVKVHTLLADLDTYPFGKEQYDLIANFYFLDRKLIPKIKRGLKKGGRVIFETYLIDHRDLGTGGPKPLRYYLRHNELLRLFGDFRILLYREGVFREGGKRKAVASLIAQKI